jgi:hypothetical protein
VVRRDYTVFSGRVLPAFRSALSSELLRGRRGLLLALFVVELGLLVGLLGVLAARAGGEDGEFAAMDTLLAEGDLPSGWVPIEAAAYPYMTNSPLVRLLMEEETVAGAFSAYRDPEDSAGVATYVVFRPDAPLALQAEGDQRTLETMTPLVAEMERLARQRLGGALPELFFASSDVPVPGALRGRSLAPPYGEGVQSESILFTTGPVMALVVVEHPRGQEPFRSVEELAQVVYSRIQRQLD